MSSARAKRGGGLHLVGGADSGDDRRLGEVQGEREPYNSGRGGEGEGQVDGEAGGHEEEA